jgi:hypothetical protein
MNVATHEQSYLDISDIRARVDGALNRLSARLVGRMSDPAQNGDELPLQLAISKLGQIAAGLTTVDPECLPKWGAGYGSTVVVENLHTRQRDTYLLMVGSLVDIDADQVSLASPIGQALLGRAAGEQVSIDTPYKSVDLRIISVTSLMDWLESGEFRCV